MLFGWWLLWLVDFVGVFVVLEGYGYVFWGVVDVYCVFEGGVFFDCGVWIVVVFDVFDVFGVVFCGFIGENLLYIGLCFNDV